ncbi:methylated-DNA--protein-cysteine methyltransferase isoform X5 [Struthio camelus]|uniref:methylated-DNA--protein-cysteine methyltransferase isoform X5 n=1 Tax=Struthio camelus TaxID=8801 RepID=UPI0036042E75
MAGRALSGAGRICARSLPAGPGGGTVSNRLLQRDKRCRRRLCPVQASGKDLPSTMASRFVPKATSKNGESQCKVMHAVLHSPVGKIEISGCETGLHEIKLPKMNMPPNSVFPGSGPRPGRSTWTWCDERHAEGQHLPPLPGYPLGQAAPGAPALCCCSVQPSPLGLLSPVETPPGRFGRAAPSQAVPGRFAARALPFPGAGLQLSWSDFVRFLLAYSSRLSRPLWMADQE